MKEKLPLVSVFVLLGNNPEHNQTVLDSINAQTYPNLEIIRNTLDLRSARGDYILVATCDDVYEPSAISDLVKVFSEDGFDMVFFNMTPCFESNDDVRVSDPGGARAVSGYGEYQMSGFLQVGTPFLMNMNPGVGGCIFSNNFLIRCNLKKIANLQTFVSQALLHRPRAYVLADNLGVHLVRPGQGAQTENDLITQKVERFNYLYRYAKASFWLRHWRKPLRDALFTVSARTGIGILGRLRPNDSLPKCSIHLVDHCNLNCKSCSHFSCLARAGDYEITLRDFCRDLRRLHRVVRGRLEILELYGGEPLLHPNVLPFMKYARRIFPRTLIRFITNGILLPQQKPEFWKTAHRYKILISPTKYPIHIDWASVTETAKKYRAELDFFMGTGYCLKTLYHKPLDLSGGQNPALSFLNCQHAGCINLYKGRLYHCPVAAYIKYFNRQFGTNLPLSTSDSLDIHERGVGPTDVFEFCARPIPFCRYCASRATTYGHPWEPTKKDISEWTLIKHQ